MSSSPEIDASEDLRLLTQIGAGDRDSFRQLYERYSPPLFSLAVRMVRDNGVAEEALQDAFVKIWRHAADYDSRKSRPFTWAVTILRRTCIDYVRKQRRTAVGTSLPEDELATPEFATRENIRQTAEFNEATTRVSGALATLASPQRDALELALFSTLTYPEIAARLAHPVGTIKTWIRRGLLDLRDRLREPAS